jgi:CBS domain-containing protein
MVSYLAAAEPAGGQRHDRACRELAETRRERIMTADSAQEPSSRPRPARATAGDIMRPAVTSVEPDAHLAAAAYLMKHAGATALVVVGDQDTRPVGLITEADIVQAVADGKDMNEARIRELMTTHPTVISAATSIRDAAESMTAGHFRHLPVVDDAGLVGMVDIRDVCRALLDETAGPDEPAGPAPG